MKISINSTLNVFIYAAYIPPNSRSNVYMDHLSAINKIKLGTNDTIIVMGDFNLPLVNWMTDDSNQNVLIPFNTSPQFAADFIQNIISNGMFQINSIRNPDKRLLDLVFTNDFSNVEVTQPSTPLSKIDNQYHPPILLTYGWHMNNEKDEVIKTRNFFKADFISMNRYFEGINFPHVFANKSLNDKVNILPTMQSINLYRSKL